jgi:hypothetical protein
MNKLADILISKINIKSQELIFIQTKLLIFYEGVVFEDEDGLAR